MEECKQEGSFIQKDEKWEKSELSEEQQKISQEIEEFLRLIGKIPFLRPGNIDEELINFFIAGLSSEAQEKVSNYVIYFKNQWLRACKPGDWSIHGEAHITNNFAESRNRDLKSLFGDNPMPWDFVRTLVTMQITVMHEFSSVDKPKVYDREREKRIKDLSGDYALGQMNRVDLILAFVNLDRNMDTKDIEEFLGTFEDEEKNEEEKDEGRTTRENQEESKRTPERVLTERNEEMREVEEHGIYHLHSDMSENGIALSDLQRFFSTFTPDA